MKTIDGADYMKKIIVILVVSCLLTVGISASVESTEPIFTKDVVCTGSPGEANWTYMFYWMGDQDKRVEGEMLHEMNLMELSGSTSDVNIVVQADDLTIWGGPDTSGSTRRYLIQHNESIDELANYTLNENVWYLEEKNMADPNTLRDFITWINSSFPAEKYVLQFAGHGYGWRQVCWDVTSGSFTNPEAVMSVPDLENVLSSVCPHLEILVFFGCHMGQIEVFYEMKDCADITIGAETAAAFSPPMIEIPLKNLTSNPNIKSVELAQLIVDNYDPQKHGFPDHEAPMFGMQSKDMDNIANAIDDLSEAIIISHQNDRRESRKLLYKAFRHSEMPCPNIFPPPFAEKFHDSFSHELYEFAEKLCELTENQVMKSLIYNTAKKLLSIIDNSSILTRSENPKENFHGTAICSPPHSIIDMIYYYTYTLPFLSLKTNHLYSSTAFAQDTQWDDVVDIMYPLRRVILNIYNRIING
jgi:hypothetical protein